MSEKKNQGLSELSTGLKTIDQFIKISKDVTKLPSLLLADYKGCVNDFKEVCTKILDGNENVVRWFHKFLYFDFKTKDAKKDFIELKTKYEELKTGSGYQELKFYCGEIDYIYQDRIKSKLGEWFQKKKLAKAERVFNKLTKSDADMVTFVFKDIFGRLSDFADKAENYAIDKDNLKKAEELKLEFKINNKELVSRLQNFSNELAELILEFSKIARKRKRRN